MIKSEQHGHVLEFDDLTHRYYLTYKGEDKPTPLVSITTTNKAFPVAEGLIQWRVKNGISEYITGKKLSQAGAIGTICHELFTSAEEGKKVVVPDVPQIKNAYKLFESWREHSGKEDKVIQSEQIICSPHSSDCRQV